MTVITSDDLTGTPGAVPNAAAIGMTTLSGSDINYVTPGWKLTSCVEYADGSYAEKSGTFPDRHWTELAFKADGAPDDPCRIMYFRVSTGAVVASLRMLPTGALELNGSGSSSDVTAGTDYAGVWVRPDWEVNQASGWVTVWLYNRLENLRESLQVPVGGAQVTHYREGAIDPVDGFRVRFAQRTVQTTPLFVERSTPNIVYVVLDDAPAQAYVKHMSEVQDYAADGVILDFNFEATPLCAPSRATMISGNYPQRTGVFGNGGATDAFRADPSNEPNSIYARLQRGSYRTYHGGKWLHGYHVDGNEGTDALWAPQGINWFLTPEDGAYGQFDYLATRNRDGDTERIDTTDDAQSLEGDYLTDVIAADVEEFIDDHFANYEGLPFFAFLAPYAGHNNVGAGDPEDPGGPKYPAAPRDRPDTSGRPNYWPDPQFPATGDLGDNPPDWPDYQWPEQSPNWNTHPSPRPGWHNTAPLSNTVLNAAEADYLDVIRQVQSVNDMLAAIKAQLQSYGAWNNTVVMITSDNGYSRGEHALPPGKGTAYDAACRLPIVVRPPGGTDTPRVSSALTQPIDLLPTCMEIAGLPVPSDVDGESWWGEVTGTRAHTRETAFLQYVSGDVDSWEDALGTGEPPDWYAVRSREALYITYDRDNPAPPEANRGEAYYTPDDPGMIDNLFPDLAAFRSYPIQSLIQAFLAGAGPTSRLAQGQPFTLGVGQSAGALGGPVYVWNGADMEDAQGRWKMVRGTTSQGIPEFDTDDVRGTYGLEVADGWDGTMSSGPGIVKLQLLINDYDDRGRSGGPFLLAETVTAVTSMFDTRKPGVLGERPAKGWPVAWEARARPLGSVVPEYAGGMTYADAKEAGFVLQLPDGVTESPQPYTWSVKFTGPTAEEPMLVGPLTGSSAPIRGALVRVHGPANGFFIVDEASKFSFEWSNPDEPLTDEQWVLIDTRRWIARLLTTNTWDLTAGDDVSGYLDNDAPYEDLLVLHPEMFEGNPFDRRVYITAGGANRTQATRLEIQAKRARRA